MEREKMQKKSNLMTLATKNRLKKQLEKAEKELSDARLSIGEAAGPESDWHDNAAFDHAQMRFDLGSARVRDLREKLQNVELIEPRKDIDKVNIGNTVVLEYKGMGKEERFTILGPDDSGTRKDWISYQTPLGESIVGSSQGEIVSFRIGDRHQEVLIKKVLPGDFSNDEGNS